LDIGLEDSTVERDDWLRSPGSRDGCEGDISLPEDLGTVPPMSELFDRYIIPEVPPDKLSYRRSLINTEPIYGFDDLQSIVETGATIFDQQSPEEPRSAGQESREVLATPPEVTDSHPPDDRHQLTLSETVMSAIAELLSLRLPQLSRPAVVMKEILHTLSTLVAAAFVLRRLQTIRSDLTYLDMLDSQQAEEHQRELKIRMDKFFLELTGWDLPQYTLSRYLPSPETE